MEQRPRSGACPAPARASGQPAAGLPVELGVERDGCRLRVPVSPRGTPRWGGRWELDAAGVSSLP